MHKKMDHGRRKFLKATTLGLFGAGAAVKEGWAHTKGGNRTHLQEHQEKPTVKIKEYRTLGRTGFKASDLGTGYIREEGIMAAMLDAGINYIDTGESYPGSHQMIGKVIKDRDRKSLFITSKMLMEGETSKEALLKRTQKILQDLGTEYVDCMMLHCPETVEALQHEGFHAAMQELKANGRIRYVGVSNHGSFWFRDPEQTMDKILLAAAEDGRFDIFLFAYNFLRMDRSEKVLEVCNQKKIGTTLMKTTPVFNYYKVKSSVERTEKAGKEVHPLYKEGLVRFKANLDKAEEFVKKHNLQNPDEIRAAAIRFALSNPNVNTVCCSISTYDDLDRILSLSGTKLDTADKAVLTAYRKGLGKLYCRHACGVCELSCPQRVPVNTIMRYSHYFIAQGREREAMELYNKIPGAKADVCSACSGPCETACPYGVTIQGMLLHAHAQLSLA